MRGPAEEGERLEEIEVEQPSDDDLADHGEFYGWQGDEQGEEGEEEIDPEAADEVVVLQDDEEEEEVAYEQGAEEEDDPMAVDEVEEWDFDEQDSCASKINCNGARYMRALIHAPQSLVLATCEREAAAYRCTPPISFRNVATSP